ncbi:CBS domain-containing protein [Vogesella fluminis]
MQTVRQLLENKAIRELISVGPEMTVFQALQVMAERDVGAILVMEMGDVVGIFPSATMHGASYCWGAPRPAPRCATS